jgi:hypothetical protein
VSSALITTLVAAAFLYPCEILLFPPFATFLIASGVFGIVQGFCVLPALVALLSVDRHSVTLFKEREPMFANSGAAEMREPLVRQEPPMPGDS